MEHKAWNIRYKTKSESRASVVCSMLHAPCSKGFTIVEMLIVLAIMGILLTIVTGVFSKATGRMALDKKTAIILSILEQARSQTLSAKGASEYGVHFEATKVVLFTGPIYSVSSASNVIEPVGQLVSIGNISLAGGGSNVVFNRLTGETGQSGSVTISLVASSTQSKTITIFPTGLALSN